MRRSELIRTLAALFEAGAEATDILVVVRLRDRDGESLGQVGAFGDVEHYEVAAEMLVQAWRWTQREGRPIDSSGVILAMLAPPTEPSN